MSPSFNRRNLETASDAARSASPGSNASRKTVVMPPPPTVKPPTPVIKAKKTDDESETFPDVVFDADAVEPLVVVPAATATPAAPPATDDVPPVPPAAFVPAPAPAASAVPAAPTPAAGRGVSAGVRAAKTSTAVPRTTSPKASAGGFNPSMTMPRALPSQALDKARAPPVKAKALDLEHAQLHNKMSELKFTVDELCELVLNLNSAAVQAYVSQLADESERASIKAQLHAKLAGLTDDVVDDDALLTVTPDDLDLD
jgi:hypothetical protein